MNHLKVSLLGPIKEADIKFGDLTLMVGPQASGKSILLQLLKLLLDEKNIRMKVEQYGFVWGKTYAETLNRYFGEGMAEIWSDETQIEFNGKNFPLNALLSKSDDKVLSFFNPQSLFYIPAQRILCLQNGWPRFYNEYDDSVPFVLRAFSESIRLFAEQNLAKSDSILSQLYGLNAKVKNSFDDTIFHHGKIQVDTTVKKRFKLDVGKSSIPFTVWSAGQKEFMPLLLSFYYLCSDDKSGMLELTTKVIIEEPEMGLHPQAIKSVMLQILDLMHRGYQVIVSTHSPVLLELLWAINYIKNKNYNGTTSDLFELFSLQPENSIEEIFKEVIASKTFATYFFDKTKDGVIVKNISTLDAGSGDPAVASWGGLTDFASRSGDVVSKLVANEE